MLQAIVTKYLPPTNTKGARISVRAYAGRMIIDWDHNVGPDENHKRAAKMYQQSMGWKGALIGGSMPDNSGFCFTMLNGFNDSGITETLKTAANLLDKYSHDHDPKTVIQPKQVIRAINAILGKGDENE